MASSFFKPVTSTISTRQEKSEFSYIGTGLTYSLCDRTINTDKNTNYFMSFNLPVTYSALSSGSTLALSHPEILQVNVDKIVIVPIPRENYSEFIDGRSITFTVPQLSGATGMSAKTLVSSTYSVLQKKDNDIFLGNNLAFLFCDEINLPYTGRTGGAISHSANSTWNTTVYTDRPAAVPYSDLSPSDIFTDKRPISAITQATPVSSTYPTNTNQGYNYDIPVGFVCLDKGYMILTHPSIVNNMPWLQGYEQYTNNINALSGTSNIYFSATTSNVTFMDMSVNYKTSVICIGLPGEFYFTSNPSWDLNKNAREFNNGTNNFDSLHLTEIGLYNKNSELIAIAKLSEPVEKTFTNLLTFNMDIDV